MTDAAVATKPKTKVPRFIINVALSNDREPVRQFIGADGKDFLITRGQDVEVPATVLSVLDDAVQMVDETDPMDPNKVITVARKRFPYTIVRAL